jgi:DNA polymerase-3 subunit delta'
MSWQGIQGHDQVADRFRRTLAHGRLANTFLFVGPSGIGKRKFALRLAQALLCPYGDPAALAPCGRCDSCVQVDSRTHPDLMVVTRPPDKSFIPVSAFIGEGDKRMREGLCHDIALKPFMGGRKVAIIDDADYLNEEGANCLLKTLEEPPPKSVLILIGTSADRQLPTIRSRAQLVRFQPLAPELVAQILLDEGLAADRAAADRLAAFSEGSVERAVALADEDLWTFRGRLLDALTKPQLASVSLAAELVPFVESAGKEAGPRRQRARQLVTFVVEFYRQLLRRTSGAPCNADPELAQAVERAAHNPSASPEMAAAGIDRSLEALMHIDRNAHQTTLLECWLDDLARITASGHAVPSYDGV